jgi:DNA (cytosine-5)-methyltransferase 1
MGAGKTVDAWDAWDAWTERMQAGHGNGNGHGKSLAIEAQRLLPSPRTSDTNGAGLHGTGGPDLRTVASLLPTPTSADAKASGGSSPSDVTLTDAVVRTDFGGRPNPRHEESHAAAHQANSDEDLRGVRATVPAQAVWEAARGLLSVHAPEALQPVLREHQARGDEGRPPLAGSEASRGLLRDLLHHDRSARSPQGQEPGEQRPDQPRDAVQQLSPETALARGSRGAHGSSETSGHNFRQDWREYEAAIRRWEIHLGRPAPDPTELTAKGTRQLSARFCEWLMGLPVGHVTDPAIGISRNDMLKALGNGVVPQQAAAATRAFVHDISQERDA